MEINAVAVCEQCGDALPVIVSEGGDVSPLRPGESCMCGDEAFRIEEQVDGPPDDLRGAEPSGDAKFA